MRQTHHRTTRKSTGAAVHLKMCGDTRVIIAKLKRIMREPDAESLGPHWRQLLQVATSSRLNVFATYQHFLLMASVRCTYTCEHQS
jgi:hypothetical protein